MIKAICFDLDGVYFPTEGKLGFEKSLIKITGNEEKVKFVLYKSPEMREFVVGHMSENDFWNFVRSHLHINQSNDELIDLCVKDYTIDTDVQNFIQKIRSKGYIACTCSNNNVSRVTALQNKFRFLDDFDVTVFSYQTGLLKPQKVIYLKLLNDAKIAPDELVLSDDNPERIQGALELGINVFIYENFKQFVDNLKSLGVDFS